MKIFKLAYLIFFIIFLYCYEYEEEVIFNPDYSGKVFLKYKVPISKKNQKSYIYFLPSSKEDFIKFYSVEPVKFEFHYQKDSYYDLGNIVVEFDFKNLQSFENKLLGLQNVIQFGDTLILKRKLASITNRSLENKLYSYFYEIFYQSLKGKSLKFTIKTPKHYNLTSNLGNLPYPGILVFQYSLERTLEPKNTFLWIVTIKANPFP